MTQLAPTTFPVTYYQEHAYEEPRSKWAMLTGLPESATAEELVEAHTEVVRKGLSRGRHIPKVLVWHPDPPDHDFPLKEQASLMDQLIKREHNTVPIEIHDIREQNGNIAAVYRVKVTEEQLIEEEQRRDAGPGPAPGEPGKAAGFPMGPFFIGGLICGAFSFWIMGRHVSTGTKLLVAGATGVLGGSLASTVAKKTGEEKDEQAVA